MSLIVMKRLPVDPGRMIFSHRRDIWWYHRELDHLRKSYRRDIGLHRLVKLEHLRKSYRRDIGLHRLVKLEYLRKSYRRHIGSSHLVKKQVDNHEVILQHGMSYYNFSQHLLHSDLILGNRD